MTGVACLNLMTQKAKAQNCILNLREDLIYLKEK